MPSLPSFTFSFFPRLFVGAVIAIAAVGCSTPKAVVSNEPMAFDQAIAAATDSLFQQSQEAAGFMARRSKQAVVLDPTLDAASGQQTAATQQLDRTITELRTGALDWTDPIPDQFHERKRALCDLDTKDIS